MSKIVNTVEIDRAPADVFDYVTDASKFTEWQDALVSARAEDDAPAHLGSRVVMTRKMGFREQAMTSEITEFDAPNKYAFRVVDGPVRANGKARFEPLDGGTRTRLTFEIDFEGHGIGKVLVPLVVRRQASKEVVETHVKLKQQLEATQT